MITVIFFLIFIAFVVTFISATWISRKERLRRMNTKMMHFIHTQVLPIVIRSWMEDLQQTNASHEEFNAVKHFRQFCKKSARHYGFPDRGF